MADQKSRRSASMTLMRAPFHAGTKPATNPTMTAMASPSAAMAGDMRKPPSGPRMPLAAGLARQAQPLEDAVGAPGAEQSADESLQGRLREQRGQDRAAAEADALQDGDLGDALADAHGARVGGDQDDGADDEEADDQDHPHEAGERAHEAADEGLLGLGRDLGLGVAEHRVHLRDDAVDHLRALGAQPDHADVLHARPSSPWPPRDTCG